MTSNILKGQFLQQLVNSTKHYLNKQHSILMYYEGVMPLGSEYCNGRKSIKITNFCNNKKKIVKKTQGINKSNRMLKTSVFPSKSRQNHDLNQIQIQIALAIRIHFPSTIPCYSFALLISFSFSHIHLSMHEIHTVLFLHLELVL